MFKPKTASRYLAVSLTTLTLCLGAQPSLVLAQTTDAPAAKAQTKLSVEGLNGVNSTLSDEAIQSILNDGLIGHEQELVAWNAETLTIPELVLTVPGKTKKAQPTVITYSDITLTNVEAGTAKTMSIGSIATATKLGTTRLEGITFNDISLANIARVIAPDESADETFYPLYATVNVDSGTVTTEDSACSVGAITSTNYEMRPVGEAFANLLHLVDSPDWDNGDDYALLAPLLTSYARLVTSVKTGPTEIGDFSCQEIDSTHGEGDSFGVDTITIASIEPGLYPAVSAQKIRASFDGETHLSLDSASTKALDFSAVMAVIEAAPQPITEEWIEANERNLTPNFGGFAFSGLSFDIAESDPITVTVAEFDLTLSDYINGIPSDGEVWANNIVLDIPPNESDELLSMMLLAGLTQIDGSFRVAGHWVESDQSIEVEEMSFDLKDMGSVSIDALLTNATAELFSTDTTDAISAGRAIALNALNLAVVDNGIGNVVLTALNGQMGGDPEVMRPVYADLAKGTIIAFLTDIAEAADLGEAVSQFVAGTAKHLNIGITSKSENGISLDEFEAAEDDPSVILSQINVTASAQ
jgi:hypothetical protein